MHEKIAVALAQCHSYADPLIGNIIGDLLDKANIPAGRGSKILVKPNLLQAKALACTHPAVVAAACAWLLDRGAAVEVADAPAFGRAEQVAKAIGLAEALRPLGLAVLPMNNPVRTQLAVAAPEGTQMAEISISRRALDCDAIFSLPRIKAHSQLRITLAVKNCFGCVPGLRKALIHARYGKSRHFFARMLAALAMSLPPMWALADGIIAMHVTGPSKGLPFPLGLLGASASAQCLDRAILQTLAVDESSIPLAMALRDKEPCDIEYPCQKPGDFAAGGFILPDRLKDVSFNPLQLCRSICKRVWKNLKI